MPAVKDVDGAASARPTCNNLDKQSIAIDMKAPGDATSSKRLVPRFDVVGENFKPGTMDRMGLGYKDLAPLHLARLVGRLGVGLGNTAAVTVPARVRPRRQSPASTSTAGKARRRR